MGYENFLLEKKDGVAVLTLNRPPNNAVSYALLQEIDRALDELASDEMVRALVFTGSGEKCFCAGMDVADAVNHIQDAEGCQHILQQNFSNL